MSKQDPPAMVIAEDVLAVLAKLPEGTPSQAVLLAMLAVTNAVLESYIEDLPTAAVAHFQILWRELDRHIQAGMEWQRQHLAEQVQEVIQ